MSKFPKRMLVWNAGQIKQVRIVVAVLDNGWAIAVNQGAEAIHAKGEMFACVLWKHSEDMPENPMTRNEILAFLTHTPHIVVRVNNNAWQVPHGMSSDEPNGPLIHQWATIDADGNIGDPQEFVK